MNKRALLTLAIALLAIAPITEGRGSKPSLAPGKYKAWGPDIDEIEIVKTFKASDYDSIAVMKIDTSKTPLPDPKEKWYESESEDRKSTRLNSSYSQISYAVFCLKKKKEQQNTARY